MTPTEKALLDKRKRRAAALKSPRVVMLPSGKFNCQIMVDGKRYSITDADPEVAHAKAIAMKARLLEARAPLETITVGQAIDRYIANKEHVLSPSTIAGYEKIRRNAFPELMGVPLRSLTQQQVQRAVSSMARSKSPKTVQSAYGLLSPALRACKISFDITLPQRQRAEIKIPTVEEMRSIFVAAHDTDIELPIMLAAWLGLRASEIRGLRWQDVDGKILHIRQAIVQGRDGAYVKGNKTFAGTRDIIAPDAVLALIGSQPRVDDYIIHLSGQAIYKRFSRLCARAGLPHYRFHDLRHFNASVMLALKVPDKYAMERIGHASNDMLKRVYQHLFSGERQAVADAVDSWFAANLQMNLQMKI